MIRTNKLLFLTAILLVNLLFVAIGCAEKTSHSGGQILFAEIKDVHTDKNNTLLWLKIKDKYTFGIPLGKVHLVYTMQEIKVPEANVYFNRTANVYQIDVELPTLADLRSWKQAFDNKPTIIYPES